MGPAIEMPHHPVNVVLFEGHSYGRFLVNGSYLRRQGKGVVY